MYPPWLARLTYAERNRTEMDRDEHNQPIEERSSVNRSYTLKIKYSDSQIQDIPIHKSPVKIIPSRIYQKRRPNT